MPAPDLPRPSLLAALLAVAAAPLACDAPGDSMPGETMVVQEVALELLLAPDAYEVTSERPDAPVEVGVLCPSTSWRVDGSDYPALTMPPPAEVRFTVPGGTGPVVLRASAGVDQSAHRVRGAADVGFRVRVNGEVVFDETVPVPTDRKARRNAWRHVGGDEGLFLAPGDVVELATTADGDGPPVPAGFGRLWLERHTARRREPASAERPNLVVVVMDTQRRDRLSCYGYERPTTPNVDALAARGLLFEEARATSSWTWPSTASILTGLLPQRHGVLDYASCYLANALESLPEVLQREGYTTAAFSGNPLIAPSKNFGQGFEHFRSFARFEKSDSFVPDALEWMERHRDVRFFLYLQLVEPHMEYQPSDTARAALMGERPADLPDEPVEHYAARLLDGEGWAEGGLDADRVVPPDHQRWIQELYDASVRTGDEWFGRVARKLDELGLTESTVVVFTSDHGEELFDHELFEHGHSLYPELVGVPLVIAGPGIPAGERVATPVSNRHLAPTLARIAGAELATGDAVDLLGAIPEAPVWTSTLHGWWNGWTDQSLLGVLDGRWALHVAPTAGAWGADEPTPGGFVALYDARDDPTEQTDVAADHPDVVERLRAALDERLEREAAARVALPVPAGAATEAMLQAVGYLGDDDEPDGD